MAFLPCLSYFIVRSTFDHVRQIVPNEPPIDRVVLEIKPTLELSLLIFTAPPSCAHLCGCPRWCFRLFLCCYLFIFLRLSRLGWPCHAPPAHLDPNPAPLVHHLRFDNTFFLLSLSPPGLLASSCIYSVPNLSFAFWVLIFPTSLNSIAIPMS